MANTRNSVLMVIGIAAILVTLITACNTGKADTLANPVVSNDSLVKRGAYLVTVGGCDDCHSPKKFGPKGPEVDMDRRLSGFPDSRSLPSFDTNAVRKGLITFNEDLTSASGPWGVSFSANLTSDQTGLGNWTEERFFKAIREGMFKGLDGGRGLLPPMPWQNLRQMSDDDLKAIFAFLKSTKPVKNVVPGTRQLAELK
jgi:hypothetical protein